jgi:hypothetical protein
VKLDQNCQAAGSWYHRYFYLPSLRRRLIKITFMQKHSSSISRRRPSRRRYLGCYAIFRQGMFITFRLFSLPSGQFMHVSGSQVVISSSFAPPI